MRLALCLPFSAIILAAQAPINVNAPIQRVRLHPDEAWVTRIGKARIQAAGTYRVTIPDLPAGLGIQDIRVSAKGPQGTRLGDFGIGAETRDTTESPEYLALKKERDALQDKIHLLDSEVQALNMEVKFLTEFRAAYNEDISTKLLSGTLSGGQIVDVSSSLSTRIADVMGRARIQGRLLTVRNEELRQLDAKMRQLAPQRNAMPNRTTVEITTQRPGEVEVELTYRTRLARWSPAYEARLAADEKSLELVLFASTVQTSGEDWSNVALEITNSRASRSLVMPTLPGAQVVTWSEFAPMPRETLAMDGSIGDSKARASYSQNAYIPPPPPPANQSLMDAVHTEATTIEEIRGLSTTWFLDGPKDIPSNGEPYRFRVLSTEVKPGLDLMAVPRVDPTVYRVARFPLPSGLPLFPSAPMVHFAGTQRLGEAPLVVPRAGQPIQLGFGPYRGIRVALSRIDARKETVGAFTKETQWILQERFEVSNDLNEPITVEIQDRELRAGNDRVKISFQPERAPITENQTPGILSWKFDIQPKTTVNMPFTYQIRVPQGQGRISGIEELGLPN